MHRAVALASAFALLALAGACRGGGVPTRVAPSPAQDAVYTPVTDSLFGGPVASPRPARPDVNPTPAPTAATQPGQAPGPSQSPSTPSVPLTEEVRWRTRQGQVVAVTVEQVRAVFPFALRGNFKVGASGDRYLYDAALPDFDLGAVVYINTDPEGRFVEGYWRLVTVDRSGVAVDEYTALPEYICTPVDVRWTPSGEAVGVKFSDPACGFLLLSDRARPLWQHPTHAGDATIFYSPDSEWMALAEFGAARELLRVEFRGMAEPGSPLVVDASERPVEAAPFQGYPEGTAEEILEQWDNAFAEAVEGVMIKAP